MEFDSKVFTIAQDGYVATLWLDRTDRLNAMGQAFWEDLPRAMAVLSDDPSVRVVIVAAKGRVFTAGLDLQEMGGLLMQGPEEGEQVVHRKAMLRTVKAMQAAITSVADCPKPVIAAVQGACIGGGVDLITACDLRLATRDAVFSVRETKMAIVADLGTLQRLPKIIPSGHVAELVYSGKDIDAERARLIGLVNDLYEDAEALRGAAHTLAQEMAANSPLVVEGCKAILKKNATLSEAEALDYVALWNTTFLQSNDLAEAIMAFMEKRAPSFTGS